MKKATSELRQLMEEKGRMSLSDLLYIHKKTRDQLSDIERINSLLTTHLNKVDSPPTIPVTAEGAESLKSD